MSVYYNEWDSHAAQWISNLGKAGLVAPGTVDTRDIREVRSGDVRHYTRCHFFAGIAGWEFAIQLAGWNPDEPVWTGSCPCQPFSIAGKGKGEEDERHLWPDFFRLIRECRPPVCFGEQVASDAGYRWLAGVRADLESEGYRVGCADLPAACLGAPHIRQRLFWVADLGTRQAARQPGTGIGPAANQRTQAAGQSSGRGQPGRMADAGSRRVRAARRGTAQAATAGDEGTDWQRQRVRPDAGTGGTAEPGGVPVGLGHAECPGLEGHGRAEAEDGRCDRGEGSPSGPAGPAGPAGPGAGFWDGYAVVSCRDGKYRRVPQSVLLSLDHGLPAGMAGLLPRLGYPLARGVRGRANALRGLGNAIVPQVAAAFIRAYLDARDTP